VGTCEDLNPWYSYSRGSIIEMYLCYDDPNPLGTVTMGG
jgi:hypothetical protein